MNTEKKTKNYVYACRVLASKIYDGRSVLNFSIIMELVEYMNNTMDVRKKLNELSIKHACIRNYTRLYNCLPVDMVDLSYLEDVPRGEIIDDKEIHFSWQKEIHMYFINDPGFRIVIFKPYDGYEMRERHPESVSFTFKYVGVYKNGSYAIKTDQWDEIMDSVMNADTIALSRPVDMDIDSE